MTVKTRMRWTGAIVLLVLPLACGNAHASTEMACQDAQGSVWPASPGHPCPTQTMPPALATASGTGFDFTVTATDQVLPLPPSSPGLALPGNVIICNPLQVFGTATINTSYVNVNWYNGSSVTTPTEQIAPGVCEVSWYLTVPPHVSLNNPSSPSVVVGVGQ